MNTSMATLKWQKDIFGVSDDQFKLLTDLYKISPVMLTESLALIKDWYSKQSHLPKIEFDNRILERFLGVNKFSVEKTKCMLDNMFTSRSLMPEFFSNRDPWSTKLSVALNTLDWAVIPKLTSENYRIHFIKINGEDPDLYDPETAFAISFMIGDIKISLDITLGDIYVWDLENLKLSQALKITPMMLKKGIFITQACYASHIKGIHLVNVPPYAEFIINIIKSVMKKKIADRVHSHKNLEDLCKAFPKDLIPKDMGGNFPKSSRELADLLRDAIKSPEWRKVYLESMEQKSDESKRTNKSETMDNELQGLGGTFRKLEFD